jgi:hypothetical protein
MAKVMERLKKLLRQGNPDAELYKRMQQME